MNFSILKTVINYQIFQTYDPFISEKFYKSDGPPNPKPNDFALINPAVFS